MEQFMPLFSTINFSFPPLPISYLFLFSFPLPQNTHKSLVKNRAHSKKTIENFCGIVFQEMDIELAKCECCGLKEDCTLDYISQVKENFNGKWLCGLCSEAVRDEVKRGKKQFLCMEDAVKAHMTFCRKYKSNPAIEVADGMRQMLRRRSDVSSSSNSPNSSKKYSRSTSSISYY